MQYIKNKMDEETLRKIIAAAYKDADWADRLKIYFLAKRDAEVKRIFNEYKTTAEVIRNIPLERMPDSVINSIKLESGKENFFALRPAFMVAVSLVVVTIAIAVILFQNKKDDPVYTKTEIELAEEQVKVSLAIVNKIFKKTENLMREEVFPKRVGEPIHKSLTIINDVLTGG